MDRTRQVYRACLDLIPHKKVKYREFHCDMFVSVVNNWLENLTSLKTSCKLRKTHKHKKLLHFRLVDF